jgi:hypothetical protein
VVAKVGSAVVEPDGKLDGSRELRHYAPKVVDIMRNDQFDVELVNQVKLANSVVAYHRIGQFQEMANSVQQIK